MGAASPAWRGEWDRIAAKLNLPMVPVPAQLSLTYETRTAPARPTSVLVIGIIGIVYASFGLLGGVFQLVSIVVLLTLAKTAVAGVPGAEHYGWNVVFGIGDTLLAATLLAGSIASVRLLRWGRRVMLYWAPAYLAWHVFQAAVQALVILPVAMASFNATAVGPAGTPGPAPMFMSSMIYAGVIIGLVISAAFPICVLFFMTRPHVRESFDRGPNAVPDAAALPSAERVS